MYNSASRVCVLLAGRSLVQQFSNINVVRWRKPPWAPLAASKLFYVPERKKQDPVEYDELKTRYNHYRTTLRSLRLLFRAERLAQEATLTDKAHVDQQVQDESLQEAESSKFNIISAKLRSSREERELIKNEEKQLKVLKRIEEKQQKLKQDARETLLNLQKEAATFIRPEDIEAVIETALNKRSSYNFAIDLGGNRYVEQSDGSVKVVPSSEQ